MTARLIGDSQASPWPGIVAGLGGAALGALVTYLATWRQVNATRWEGNAQRRQLKEESDAQRNHELALAREERDESRKLSVYAALVQYAIYAQLLAAWQFRESRRCEGEAEPVPDMPLAAKDAESLAVLIGSEPVREKATELNLTLQRSERACEDFRRMRGTDTPEELKRDVAATEALQTVIDTAVALIDLLRSEIGTGTRGASLEPAPGD